MHFETTLSPHQNESYEELSDRIQNIIAIKGLNRYYK